MKNAFTMIELIFVIVILGILSAVALPKFAGIRKQADIVNAKAQASTIRAAIANNRQKKLILGTNSYISEGNLSTSSTSLFDGVLTTSIKGVNSTGHWHTTAVNIGNGVYNYKLSGGDLTFTYEDTNGTFKCTSSTSADVNCTRFN
jgi:general secretion pathway protein G